MLKKQPLFLILIELMFIKYSGFNIYAESKSIFRPPSGFIFFLHGFTGSSEDWNQIIPGIDSRFACAVIDLIGHGRSDSPDGPAYYLADSIADQIYSCVNAF
ncbi:MAG TPA: alpha/beta fold hydrolase, partial [Ignavibacteriaceae bacterium]|nr:alpha/beta fold hydrolase [Ignavibacteriaceae bacterium]